MQTNLLWTGREYYSLENCLVYSRQNGTLINSVIVGKYEEKLYRVEYTIKVNNDWETLFVELKSQQNNRKDQLLLQGDGKGNWLMNGNKTPAFNGCIDVDIPLTPFTNTLPINRLQLKQKEEQDIRVIYIDVLAEEIKVVSQKYLRISANTYHYENIPNDFEADIRVDDSGFVEDYPVLFIRTADVNSNYP